MPRMINNICAFGPRDNMIYDILIKNVAEGRDILILSDRRQHLTNIFEHVEEHNIGSVGYYVGGMKPAALRDTTTKQIILGTFSMASEGMDIPKLNTIILASPKSDVVQSIGRILREKADVRKFHPLVIDFKDTHPNLSIFNKQCDKRIAYYKKSNHEIHIYDQEGSKIKLEKRKKKNKKEIYEIKECLID